MPIGELGYHDRDFCSDCHRKTNATRVELKFSENVTSDFVHHGDYLTRHAIEARADQALCQRACPILRGKRRSKQSMDRQAEA